MYQLNYRSQARNEFQTEDLDAILSTANSKNAALNISGCLVFHNGYFVQILEGKKEDVIELFEKIKEDDRHHNVSLLGENSIEQAYFPEWNMAYYEPNDQSVRHFVYNMISMAELSDKSTQSLQTFWAEVRKVLLGG